MNCIWSVFNVQSYSKKSKQVLNAYGNQKIKSMTIIRYPLNDALTYIANHLDTVESYDKLYHIYLLITLDNKTLLVEKNEQINIDLKIRRHRDDEQSSITNINVGVTLNSLLLNTKKLMGSNYYSYEIELNNCQNFIKSILAANNLLTDEREQFIMQDLTTIFLNHKNMKQLLNSVIDVAVVFTDAVEQHGSQTDT